MHRGVDYLKFSKKLSEIKKYLSDPKDAPKGVKVQRGPKGGHYYDTEPPKQKAGEIELPGRKQRKAPPRPPEGMDLVTKYANDILGGNAVRTFDAKLPRSLKKHIIKMSNLVKKGFDTVKKHKRGGKWTESRKNIHNLIKENYRKKIETSAKPTVYLVAGLPGSGKSTMVKQELKGDWLTMNNDEIKDQLPEFQADHKAAMLVHQEAKELEGDISEEIIEKKADFIWDATFRDEKQAEERIKKLKKQGYNVKFLGTLLPIEKAIERAYNRAMDPKDGRYVPLDLIRKNAKQIYKTMEKMRDWVDEYHLYNTDVPFGELPIKVENYKDKLDTMSGRGDTMASEFDEANRILIEFWEQADEEGEKYISDLFDKL